MHPWFVAKGAKRCSSFGGRYKVVIFPCEGLEGEQCYNMSRRALESLRTKGTAEEEIRLRAYFRPATGDINLTKQIYIRKEPLERCSDTIRL